MLETLSTLEFKVVRSSNETGLVRFLPQGRWIAAFLGGEAIEILEAETGRRVTPAPSSPTLTWKRR